MILSLTKILAGPIVIYSGEKKELFTFYVSHSGRKEMWTPVSIVSYHQTKDIPTVDLMSVMSIEQDANWKLSKNRKRGRLRKSNREEKKERGGGERAREREKECKREREREREREMGMENGREGDEMGTYAPTHVKSWFRRDFCMKI